MSSFVSYLLSRANKELGVENALKTAISIHLDMLAHAFNERSDNVVQNQPPRSEITEEARQLADRLITGDLIVINDVATARNYFVVAYGKSLVAVYYTLGAFYNFYSAISSDPEMLTTLGIHGYYFRDISKIDKIFNFTPLAHPLGEDVVIEEEVTVVEPAPVRPATWYTPDVPRTPNEVVEDGVLKVKPEPDQLHHHVSKAASTAPDTQMGRAFRNMAMAANPARGDDRRTVEERRDTAPA